jgi:hypothetical protein
MVGDKQNTTIFLLVLFIFKQLFASVSYMPPEKIILPMKIKTHIVQQA